MSTGVNPRRSYNATRRQEQARLTRLAVLDASRRLFLEHGYAGTTVAAVAREAGVSVETIYKAFGRKPELVKAVFDVAVVGDDEPIPLMERAFVQENMAEPDPAIKLRSYGHHYALTATRANPIQLVVRDAAVTDPGAAAVWAQLQSERLIGMTAFANHLADAGHLRPDVTVDEARDVLWTHNSVEVWDLLVRQRQWPLDRFGAWVGHQLVGALL